jgi:hypothetical protein
MGGIRRALNNLNRPQQLELPPPAHHHRTSLPHDETIIARPSSNLQVPSNLRSLKNLRTLNNV